MTSFEKFCGNNLSRRRMKVHFPFQMLRSLEKTRNLLLTYTVSPRLVVFSPIFTALLMSHINMDLYILCYIAVLEFVLIGRSFIMKLINLNLYFLKITILATLQIFVLRFFSISYIIVNSLLVRYRRKTFLVLPFLGPTSLEIRTRLRILFSKKLPFYNLRIIFRFSCRLKTFFHFKDRIPKYLRSGLIYKFKCAGCIATYYGKTKRHFKVRACEHLGIIHVHKYQTPNWTLRKSKKNNFPHNVLINLLKIKITKISWTGG